MNFAEIQASVYTITNRPNLVNETILAIQEATMALHGIENWWRDRVEQQVVFSANGNYQQIPLATLPRFRTFSYIRKFDPTGTDPLTGISGGGAPGDLFDPCPPDKLLDPYKITKDNIYYLTGGGNAASAVAQLRSTVAFQYLLIAWMRFPQVDVATYQSWIAELYPYAIITAASMKLRKYMVDADAAKILEGDAAMHLNILLANNVEYQSR